MEHSRKIEVESRLANGIAPTPSFRLEIDFFGG